MMVLLIWVNLNMIEIFENNTKIWLRYFKTIPNNNWDIWKQYKNMIETFRRKILLK